MLFRIIITCYVLSSFQEPHSNAFGTSPIYTWIYEDFILFHKHDKILIQKETASQLSNWQYFGTHEKKPAACSTQTRISKKKCFKYQTCVFSLTLQPSSEMFLILRKTGQDITKMCWCLRVKYPLFLSDFNQIWIFSTDFQKILNIKFQKNLSCRSWVIPCGQTDRNDKTNCRFS